MTMTPQEYKDALHLAHFGSKGMRWGIRRYQNEDGTYTELGKERRRVNNPDGQRESRTNLKIGAAALAGALAVYGGFALHSKIKNRTPRVDEMPLVPLPFDVKLKRASKVGSAIKEGAKNAGKAVGDGVEEGGKAAVAAAIVAVGTIAVRKLTERFSDREGDSQNQKDLNYIAREASTAGVRRSTDSTANSIRNGASNSNKNNSGNNNSGSSNNKDYKTHHILSDIVDRVGKPHQVHSYNDPDVIRRYNNLMQQYNHNDEVKSAIRSMRSGTFDIDQIEKRFK